MAAPDHEAPDAPEAEKRADAERREIEPDSDILPEREQRRAGRAQREERLLEEDDTLVAEDGSAQPHREQEAEGHREHDHGGDRARRARDPRQRQDDRQSSDEARIAAGTVALEVPAAVPMQTRARVQSQGGL